MRKMVGVICTVFFINAFACGDEGFQYAAIFHNYTKSKGIDKVVKQEDIQKYMKIIMEVSTAHEDKKIIELLTQALTIINEYEKNKKIYDDFSEFHNEVLVAMYHPCMRKYMNSYRKQCVHGGEKSFSSTDIINRCMTLNKN